MRCRLECTGLSLLLLFLGELVISFASLQRGLGSDDERRLLEYLFTSQGYNPLIRPVRNLNETIKVDFGLALVVLISLDERNQIMKTNVWLRMLWTDYQLKWDPNEYGGITVVRVKPEEVWTPDIVLFNNADGNYEVTYKSNVLIYSNGDLTQIPPAIYKSSCTIDVKYFPFDEQQCQMKFGSWTFNGDQLDLGWYEKLERVDLKNYFLSGTWDVIDVPAKRNRRPAEKGIPAKTEIIYTVKIRRKTLFYTVNLLTPCVLISFLSVLTFYLPADAQEKITLCISILLALVVFLLLVSKLLPPTSITIPLISKYLFFTFIMNIVTVIVTVAVININYRSPRTHKMPKVIRSVFLNWLPRILLMKRPDHMTKYSKWRKRKMEKLSKENGKGQSHHGIGIPNDKTEIFELSDVRHHDLRTEHDDINSNDNHNKLSPAAQATAEAVDYIASHMKADDEYFSDCEDWKYVAAVIDRLLLLVFLGITIGGTVGIIIDAPTIFEYIDQQARLNQLNGVEN